MNDDATKQVDEIEEETEVKEEKNEEVAVLEEKVTDLNNKYRRALADYQNLEKRVQEERSEWIKSANQQLLLRLLPALDTVMLASQHTEDKGIKATVDHFLSTLQSEGIEKIETKDHDFDPSTMEVIQIMEGTDGKVLQEVRAGYTLYGKLLRPAQVVVGQEKKEESN